MLICRDDLGLSLACNTEAAANAYRREKRLKLLLRECLSMLSNTATRPDIVAIVCSLLRRIMVH